MMARPDTPLLQPKRLGDWCFGVLAVLVLFAVLLITHGASLGDGLFFDDHWHRVTLSQRGWGFDDLVESATFDLPGRLTHLWWQDQPLQWRYARPVAMLFMKLEYVVTGGCPVGVHTCGLVWHWLTSVLVFRLACWAIGSRGWALMAAVLFLINPHSVFAVSWIAARNALISAFFLVAAVLAYIAASRPGTSSPSPVRRCWLVVAIVLWLLALFSRETAIIFPLLVGLMDLCWSGRRQVIRRIPVYTVIGVLALLYLYWRLVIFPVADVPDIYFSAPAGLSYIPWALSKLLQMLLALVFYTPLFLGVATQGGLTAGYLAAHAVMLLLLGAVVVWYAYASRGLRGRWFWPLWSVAAFVPVIPVFLMPHFGYLPFVAHSVVLAILLSRMGRRWRIGVTALVVVATLWSLGVYRFAWRGIVRSEQLLYADIESTTPTPPPGSQLFFINLPVAGIYAPVAMREVWNNPDIEGYVLTFAPHPLMMRSVSRVQRVSDHELVVSADAPIYFSGPVGRMLVEGMRTGSALTTGTVVKGDVFDVTILDASNRGVTRMAFRFHEPLDHPRHYFYVSSPDRPAERLRFDDAQTPAQRAAASKRWRDEHAEDLAQRRYYFTIMDVVRRIVRTDLFLTAEHAGE